MKTHKELTIDAIHELIEQRYKINHDGRTTHHSCPLCSIYHNCEGCVNTIFTYQIAHKYNNNIHRPSSRCFVSKSYGLYWSRGLTEPRLRFWELSLSILEKLPNKAFTRTGYRHKYFKPLLEIDLEVSDSV